MEWRTIPGFPDYEVSSDGQVKRIAADKSGRFAGHIMSQCLSTKGCYRIVSLRDRCGKRSTRTVHSLVAVAFHGPYPPGKEVRHEDGIGMHNHAANLLYGTRKENAEDRIRHGNSRRGPLARDAKLSWDAVRRIRSTPFTRGTATRFAEEFGTAAGSIIKVKRGVTWREETCQLG
jgi:hypothetical protein